MSDPAAKYVRTAGSEADWPEAMAEVVECRYDVRAARSLVFGLTTKKHFRIGYNYLADGELHNGQCFSEKAMPQGTLFAIRYDPDLPRQHRNGLETTSPRLPLFAIGLAGSLLLSLGWLLLFHGCS